MPAQQLSAVTTAAATGITSTQPIRDASQQIKHGDRASGVADRTPATKKQEIPGLRTRVARSFSAANGYETEIYAGAINFQDPAGQWQPIDNQLVPSTSTGAAFRNKANRYQAELPATLGSPVRFSLDGATVQFSLEGAKAGASVNGHSAVYAGALPGVNLQFTAQADSLKETLTLLSVSAQNSFTYSLKTSAGLSARENVQGGIEFVDSAGTVRFGFAPAFMLDSSNSASGYSRAVTMKLGSDERGQIVTLTADRTWLSSSQRKFPVIVDPTIWINTSYYGGLDCDLKNTTPTTSSCSSGLYTGTTDAVGYDGAAINRALYQWSFQDPAIYTHIGPNANILDAELDLTLASSSSASPIGVGVYQITQGGWNDNPGATWNNVNGAGSAAWTTAGGTYNATALDVENIGPAAGAYKWHNLTQLIQNWVQGNGSNQGFLLRATNEAAAGVLQFDNYVSATGTNSIRPHIRVQWNNWLGQEPWYKFESHQLSDGMGIAVNVANGNLVVHNTDLAIKGTGLDQHVDRWYGSLNGITGNVGYAWNVNVGCDVRLDLDDLDGISFHGPDGYAVLYRNNGSGGWITPAGLNADLVKNGDNTYTLTFHSNGEKFNFQTGGCLQNMVDRNNNTISMSYNGTLQSITDTQSRLTQFTYVTVNGYSLISQITDPSSRTFKYGYDTSGNLTSYTDPANNQTKYAYNASQQMSQITDPKGDVVNFSYGTSYPYRLAQISYVNSTCSGGACNTSFTYNSGAGACTASGVAGNTVVTDANAHQTTHCYDNQGRVVQAIDAKGQKQASSYTSNNNVQTYADAANPSQPTQFGYDATTNNLTSATEPTGANSTWGYTQGSAHTFFPDTYTDSSGNGYSYGYGDTTSKYPNLTSTTNASTGAHWNASYNPNGTVSSNTDANGNVTSYAYDSVGNLTTITYPAPLGGVTYTSDGLSRIQTKTDGKGQKQTYSYDLLDRIIQILYNGATTCAPLTGNCIQYSYDADGNVIQLQDNTGATTFTYDTMNRQTQKLLPGTGGTISYAYDGVGNLTSLQDAGGTVGYAYDQVNELTSLTEPDTTKVTTFDYNAGYKRTDAKYPNGVWECMSYDASERLTEIKAIKPNPTAAPSAPL